MKVRATWCGWMAKLARDDWLSKFLETTGIVETIEIATGRLKLGLPQVHRRVDASRKPEIEAQFDRQLAPGKVVDTFLENMAVGLYARKELLPQTVQLTDAAALLADIHRNANGAIRRNDLATARDRFLALKAADAKTAFVFETLAESYRPYRSLVSMIAYPAMELDIAIIEAGRRAAPSDDGDDFLAYQFNPAALAAIDEINALTAGFIHGGLVDRTERDWLSFATFLASDDGRQMLFETANSLEAAIYAPLAEMLVPFLAGAASRSNKP